MQKCKSLALLHVYLIRSLIVLLQASDGTSTSRVACAILEIAHDARNYDLLNSSLNSLTKKHGQLKGAVEAMVILTMTWLEDVRTKEGEKRWLELVESLRTVTEGKVRHCDSL